MKKKNRTSIDWKIDSEKIAWTVTAIILALLIVILSSCKTHRENRVDYEISSSESYQQRRSEEHESYMAARMAERRDTVEESNTQTGQIEIERDTAGRAVKIFYEFFFDGMKTRGYMRVDTVYQKQVILLADSARNSQSAIVIEGQTKEKKEAGTGTWGLIGFGGIGLLVFVGIIVIFILIKKRQNQWKG